MPARHFSYYDDWKTAVLTCPKCGWTGVFEEGDVEHHEALMDSSCPDCQWPDSPMLAIVSYPTLAETEAHFDRLSKPEQEYFFRRKQFVQSDWLQSVEQLPELEASKITLFWDFTGTEEAGDTTTVIRFGEQVVWAEPAVWEGYERFAEVLSILRQKYGERLVDLVPTPKSELYLYGDRLSSPTVVDRARAAIRDKNP